MEAKLTEYFARPDTAMHNSPVGLAMQRLLRASPDMDFERARELARAKPFRGTAAAAGCTLSPEHREAARQRLARARAAKKAA